MQSDPGSEPLRLYRRVLTECVTTNVVFIHYYYYGYAYKVQPDLEV